MFTDDHHDSYGIFSHVDEHVCDLFGRCDALDLAKLSPQRLRHYLLTNPSLTALALEELQKDPSLQIPDEYRDMLMEVHGTHRQNGAIA